MNDSDVDDQFYAFADEIPSNHNSQGVTSPWKVLIADDDESVHAVTKMVLNDFVFDNRSLLLLHSYSGEETIIKIKEHSDTSMILLDVVMETDTSGLDVVRCIREVLHNKFVRIILRTGQPGQAPESRVVIDYDINDYKEKTELTAQKLVTAVVAALRSHRDIMTIEHGRQGLEQIVIASRNLMEPVSLVRFSQGVLEQIIALLYLGETAVYLQSTALAARWVQGHHGFVVVAGTGSFRSLPGKSLNAIDDERVSMLISRAVAEGKSSLETKDFIGYFLSKGGIANVIYVRLNKPLSRLDAELLRVFFSNIGAAFDNLYLHEELNETRSEIVSTLSGLVEFRSKETGLHAYRVGALSELLAEMIGLPEADSKMLGIIAPMHDIGKIAIPDKILHKPGRLTEEEIAVIQTHSLVGHSILARSKQPLLRTASVVALEHHEWWNGQGYPNNIKGENISIFGRIVAIADVFDAISHHRVYKAASQLDDSFNHIIKLSGTQFDPDMVAVFSKHKSKFREILETYPDVPSPI